MKKNDKSSESQDIAIQITGGTVNGSIYGGAVSTASLRNYTYDYGEGGIASVGNVSISVENSKVNTLTPHLVEKS